MLLWERILQLVLKDSHSVCRYVSVESRRVLAESGRGADCLILVLSYFILRRPHDAWCEIHGQTVRPASRFLISVVWVYGWPNKFFS